MAGGGVSRNIYGVFKNRPGGGRSGRDLLHLRDGFEIEMNFDRNVSCLKVKIRAGRAAELSRHIFSDKRIYMLWG